MNGRSHQRNGELLRYLDRSLEIDFQEIRKKIGKVNFRCERGHFADAGTSAIDSGRRVHTVKEV